jgi:hypothetical protein
MPQKIYRKKICLLISLVVVVSVAVGVFALRQGPGFLVLLSFFLLNIFLLFFSSEYTPKKVPLPLLTWKT